MRCRCGPPQNIKFDNFTSLGSLSRADVDKSESVIEKFKAPQQKTFIL